MPRFIVRKNCEYSIAVEAANEDEAMTKAAEVKTEEWETAWSPMEADPE